MNPIALIATKYIEAYQSKDLETIASLISSDVELIDWNQGGKGKEYFLSETRKNFESQEIIQIEIQKVFELDGTVALQLRITVDNAEVLEVIDVVTFNSSNQIVKLQAYKSL